MDKILDEKVKTEVFLTTIHLILLFNGMNGNDLMNIKNTVWPNT